MRRRNYLHAIGGATVVGLSGCLGGNDGTDTESGADDTEGGDTETEAETIRVASGIPYPPFEMMENGEPTGFDYDMGAAIFEDHMGREMEFLDRSFDGIISGLQNGNYRVIMSAMTITEDRKEKVDFSDPYFTAYQAVSVLENSDISSKADLRGKTVAVQKGTTGANAADELKTEFDGELTVSRYDSSASAFNAVLNNQAVAVINDNTVSAEYVNENDEALRFVMGDGVAAEQRDDPPEYPTLSIEEYGIAFRKGDDEFREQVNDVLETLRDNGTYDDIYSSYFAG
jgi:polar amino acid transport system substrate-binding protein